MGRSLRRRNPEETGPRLVAEVTGCLSRIRSLFSLLTGLTAPLAATAQTDRLLFQSPWQLGVTSDMGGVIWWDYLESSINAGVGR